MFEHNLCTVVDGNGRDCNQAVPEGAPITACLPHLRAAYLFFAEYLKPIRDECIAYQVDYGKGGWHYGVADIHVDSRPEYVYYVRIGHYIKIGTTRNMYNRMAALQPDEILGTEIGGKELERKRHLQFDHIRAPKGREYFLPTLELTDFIKSL